jgi:hypothetical protein
VKDSTITAFGRSILIWPTPGSPSHQKHGTLQGVSFVVGFAAELTSSMSSHMYLSASRP